MIASPDRRPFDDVRLLVATLPSGDTSAAIIARSRQAELTKPAGSLGRLEDIAVWLATWGGGRAIAVNRPLAAVFAGAHGVAARGVSAYPSTVNAQMLANFSQGGAAINQLCKTFDISLRVFDLAVDIPTGDICDGPAMSERDCAANMAFGMEALAGEPDLLCLGDMGIGNTTAAAAIYAALWGGGATAWVGAGTGVDADGLARKTNAVETALATHSGHLGDPLAVLARLGGREIAAIAGAILAARHQRVPVILDGYVTTAAAAVLHALRPDALDHCLAAHCSAEKAHANVLERLGLKPLLSLDMRLGEASGAALAVSIVRGAAALHSGMATFAEAGVSGCL